MDQRKEIKVASLSSENPPKQRLLGAALGAWSAPSPAILLVMIDLVIAHADEQEAGKLAQVLRDAAYRIERKIALAANGIKHD
jgi:hypothetical protein